MMRKQRFIDSAVNNASDESYAAKNLKPKDLTILVLIVLFSGIVRLPSLTQPLGPDQGIMSVIGNGILEGKLPYRDFWEMGSPAIFFAYALIFKIFGARMAVVPAADLIISMLTTLLVFIVARFSWSTRVGFVSALLFAFFSNGIRFGMHSGGDIAFGTFWFVAQRETFMLPLITAGFYFVLKSERSRYDWIWLSAAGFTGCMAVLFKFPALVTFLCFPAYVNVLLYLEREPTWYREFLRKNLSLVGGSVLALAPFVWVFWTRNALQEMYEIIFGYVGSVYGQLDSNILGLVKVGLTRTRFLAEENFIIWILFIAASLHIFVADRKKTNILMICWGGTSLLFLISHREFFGYHYLMLLPPFCLLSGYALIKILGPTLRWQDVLSVELEKAFLILALVANLGFFVTLDYLHYTKFFYYATGKLTRQAYYAFFNAYPKHDYSFPADNAVAHYVAERTAKQDRVFVVGGTDAVIYFLAKRAPASRFIFSWVLFSGRHSEIPIAETYRAELLGDLTRNRPKYIVCIGALGDYKKFRSIYDFIRSHYSLEKQFQDGRFVYVRLDSAV